MKLKDRFKALIDFVNHQKWILIILPLLFVLVFLTTLPKTYQGKLKTSEYTYVGEIKNGEPSGKGTLTYSNGDKYTGEFKKGIFNGEGVFTSGKGKWSYSGQFVNGVANGKGKMVTSDKKTQTVTFEDGVLKK